MTLSRPIAYILLLTGCGLFVAAAPVVAQTTIISDTFTTTASTPITAHTPDVDLNGGAYAVNGKGSYTDNVSGGVANPSTDIGAGVSIAGAGTSITISASIANNTLGTGTGRGTILGFFTQAPSTGTAITHGYDDEIGLLLGSDGSLSVYQGGSGNTPTITDTVAFTGATYSEATAYTLSYTVNTTTGTLSNISLSNSTANYSGLTSTLFTAANTQYAGFDVSAPATNQTAMVDNFTVTSNTFTSAAAPEPDSFVCLFIGALGLCAFQGRRLQKRTSL